LTFWVVFFGGKLWDLFDFLVVGGRLFFFWFPELGLFPRFVLQATELVLTSFF